MENVDVIVIGAGVVGLAIGAQLSKKFKHPDLHSIIDMALWLDTYTSPIKG